MGVRNWGWTIVRGVAAIIFGLLALLMPGITWIVLMGFFAAYTLIDGISALVAAMSGDTGRDRTRGRPWGLLLVEGLVGIAVAIMWVIWPARVSLAFLYVVGSWGILTGLLEIGSAIRLRRVIRHEWLLALGGVLSIAFGVVVWMHPLIGALALVWWIGSYAIVFGVVLIALGLRMRSLTSSEGPTRALPLDGRLRHQT